MASPAGDSTLSSLSDYPEDDGTVEIEDEVETMDQIKRFYAEGSPLFTKASLQKAAEALNNDVPVLEYEWNGKLRKQEIDDPPNSSNSYWNDAVRVIVYSCYQQFTLPHPNENLDLESGPLHIGWCKESAPPKCSLDDVRTAFELHQNTWLQSNTCKNLTQILESAKPTMTVDKVLCLGLGSLSARLNHEKRAEPGYQYQESRSIIQHAAAITIAQILSPPLGGSTIQILAQDPEYGDLDEQFFSERGITVLKDPQGFLVVDEKTLVISVACNVPQKQIVADLTTPAGMVWNTVRREEEEETAWTKRRADEIWTNVDWDEAEKSMPWRKRDHEIWHA